jgi:hypothetical protein
MGAHREIPRLTEEHRKREGRLPAVAHNLYLLLVARADMRRAGVGDLVRAYQADYEATTRHQRITEALRRLEEALLIRCEWRACGDVRRLISVSLLPAQKIRDLGTECTNRDTQVIAESRNLRAEGESETFEEEDEG